MRGVLENVSEEAGSPLHWKAIKRTGVAFQRGLGWKNILLGKKEKTRVYVRTVLFAGVCPLVSVL